MQQASPSPSKPPAARTRRDELAADCKDGGEEAQSSAVLVWRCLHQLRCRGAICCFAHPRLCQVLG